MTLTNQGHMVILIIRRTKPLFTGWGVVLLFYWKNLNTCLNRFRGTLFNDSVGVFMSVHLKTKQVKRCGQGFFGRSTSNKSLTCFLLKPSVLKLTQKIIVPPTTNTTLCKHGLVGCGQCHPCLGGYKVVSRFGSLGR